MKECEILLVEDNPDDIELTLLAFEETDLCENITVVRNGEEALDYLFRQGPFAADEDYKLPSVVLLDLNMPILGGLEVLKRVRSNEHTSCLPVIILTSSKEDEDIVSSYQLGANAYVRKPVDYRHFVEAAKTLGLFWLVTNQPAPRRRSCKKEE